MQIGKFDYFLVAIGRDTDDSYLAKLNMLNIVQSHEIGEYEPKTRFEGELTSVKPIYLKSKDIDIAAEEILELLKE